MKNRRILLLVIISSIPFYARLQCWEEISAGNNHSIATKIDSSMFTWGTNHYGQSGNGTLNPTNIPAPNNEINHVKLVSCGNNHTMVIKNDGTLWAWGENIYGQLGDGSNSARYIPSQIGIENDWYTLTPGGGRRHNLAIKNDGTLWAWGRNDSFQLGNGTSNHINSPIQIGTDTNWIKVAANYRHSLAIKSDGTLWAWGHNSSGQLGNGTNQPSSQPIQIGTDTNWINISAGGEFSLAMKSDSSIWGWGSNGYGQLGLSSQSNFVYQPTLISASQDWVHISAGQSFSFFIRSDGTLWTCGFNLYGELGLGNFDYTNTLTQVGMDTDWLRTTSGFKHTLAIKMNGELWAWGVNTGAIGDGTFTDRDTPVFISCSTLDLKTKKKEKGLTVFPNPSSKAINFSENVSEVIFYSIEGKYLNSIIVNGKYLEISDFDIGMYLMKIKTTEGDWLELKFLKNL